MNTESPYQPKPYVRLQHPSWCKDAVIYQINTRQFTPQGTFQAAAEQLPRLKGLGVDILWLMPVHPIGRLNRKGSLGSPYSVRDYYGVNPEFGTLADLAHFVAAAHELGMYVILDWVANHSAWDNALTASHPDWYARDWKGAFRPTHWWDWPDIIDFDYTVPALRQYMTEAMAYWVREVDVDGYRCDVAGFVPTDFWNQVRKELDAIKPVFMLAEWESRDLHAEAFDMTYAWSWHNALQAVASGRADLNPLLVYYSWNEKAYPQDALRMTFTSNHDINAWDGTEFELFGEALQAAIVLSFISEGMPLIYNGQETGNPRRLAFFEKDPIEWTEHPHGELYRQLIALKKAHPALWNGAWGARMVPVDNSVSDRVLSFARQKEEDRVFAVFNFSGQAQAVDFERGQVQGRYQDAFSGERLELHPGMKLPLEPWGYRVLLGV